MALSQANARSLTEAFRASNIVCEPSDGLANGSKQARVFGALADRLVAMRDNPGLAELAGSTHVQLAEAVDGDVRLQIEKGVTDARFILQELFALSGKGRDETNQSADREMRWSIFTELCLKELKQAQPPREKTPHCFELNLGLFLQGQRVDAMANNPQVFEEELAQLFLEKPCLRAQLELTVCAPLESVTCRLVQEAGAIKGVSLGVKTKTNDDREYSQPQHLLIKTSHRVIGYKPRNSFDHQEPIFEDVLGVPIEARQAGYPLIMESLMPEQGMVLENNDGSSPFIFRIPGSLVYELSGRRLAPTDFNPDQCDEARLKAFLFGSLKNDQMQKLYDSQSVSSFWKNSNPPAGMVEIYFG